MVPGGRCPEPPTVDNATPDRYVAIAGVTLTYTCNKGFRSDDSEADRKVTCEIDDLGTGASWTKAPSGCERNYLLIVTDIQVISLLLVFCFKIRIPFLRIYEGRTL